MCGILGIVPLHGPARAVPQAVLSGMLDDLAERGPDGDGWASCDDVVFGHRRLAIRDVAAGQQPWRSPRGDCLLTYNGELYNDAELRTRLTARGHRFRTRCDTETVMAAYLEWGVEFVQRLDGMFALGVYDSRTRRLVLARDRVGVKPLYWLHVGGHLVFASTPAPLLKWPDYSPQPDWPAVSHYLTTLRTTLGRRTLHAGVSQLQPGEQLIVRNRTVEVTRFASLSMTQAEPMDLATSAESLGEALRSAVQRRLVSDVPVGMFLSGGVDSNTLACLTADAVSQPLQGFCVQGATADGQPSDDALHAARTATHIGANLTTITVTPTDYLSRMQWMIDRLGQPLTTPNDVLIYELSRVARQHVGVVLGGEGADELLGGYAVSQWSGCDYDRTLSAGKSSAADRLARASLLRCYGRDHFASRRDHYFALNSLVPLAVQAQLFQADIWRDIANDDSVDSEYDSLLESDDATSTVEQYGRLMQAVNLPTLLLRLDQASMLAGLEARVPFTDAAVITAANRIPLAHKLSVDSRETAPSLSAADLMNRGSLRTKTVLRELARPLMPAVLSQRPKQSFPTPMAEWFGGVWAQPLQQRLLASPFLRDAFQPTVLTELTGNPQAAGMWLWPLLNLAEWGDRVFHSANVRETIAA